MVEALIGPVVTLGTIRSLLRVILFIFSLPGYFRALLSSALNRKSCGARGPSAGAAHTPEGSVRFRPFAGMTRIRF